MPKITFMGAGSTVFAKNVLGDCMLTPSLENADIALYDIDEQRLDESHSMLENLRQSLQRDEIRITPYLGVDQRKDALRNANYVINAIQVGGYEPSTVIDFEIPKKYGLQQTIGDTLGIGGIFRSLRTIPVVLDFARDIHEVCPGAWFLNYVNPMAMITKALLDAGVNTVGLCHSVQVCASHLLKMLDIDAEKLSWHIAGINHQAWLLDIRDADEDLYPLVREKAAAKNTNEKHHDMVRFEVMRRFGYYITESSEHSAEYMPYWIKKNYPELIERFNIPLDEYPRRCVNQIKGWQKQRDELVNNASITHTRSHEYASYILDAMETGEPFRIHGNVANTGLITNLPRQAVVEVPCLVDRNGVTPCHVGDLPEQCAALNRTNINVQLLTVEAAMTGARDKVYQAALLDPHTSAELSMDEIVDLCDELIDAHREYLPAF